MPQPKRKPAAKPVLSFAEIEACDDLKTETIEVPEWGGSVVVREWTAGEELEIAEADDATLLILKYGVKQPALDDDTASKLLAKSSQAVTRVVNAIHEINAGGTADAEDAAVARFPAGAPE